MMLNYYLYDWINLKINFKLLNFKKINKIK